MITKYDRYLKAKSNREEAENWNSLPDGPKYQADSFKISTAHCGLKLVRAGQQYCGGKNYWDSPQALNQVLIQLIAKSELIGYAINELKNIEIAALADCEEEVKEQMAAIQQAKEQLKKE